LTEKLNRHQRPLGGVGATHSGIGAAHIGACRALRQRWHAVGGRRAPQPAVAAPPRRKTQAEFRMSEEDPGPGPTSPGRRCGRAQRRLQSAMPDTAQIQWAARPVDRSGANAAAATPCRNPEIRGRSSESSAGARSAAGGASGRRKTAPDVRCGDAVRTG